MNVHINHTITSSWMSFDKNFLCDSVTNNILVFLFGMSTKNLHVICNRNFTHTDYVMWVLSHSQFIFYVMWVLSSTNNLLINLFILISPLYSINSFICMYKLIRRFPSKKKKKKTNKKIICVWNECHFILNTFSTKRTF